MSAGIDPIGALQDAMLARLRGGFGGDDRRALRTIAPLEAPFDAQTSSTFRVAPPAVYLTQLVVRPTDTAETYDCRFAIYCVANRATSETRERGGGGPLGIGAFAIASNVVGLFSRWAAPLDVAGTATVMGVENLAGLAFVKQHLAVMAVTVDVPISIAFENPDAALAEFMRVHTDWDVAPREEPPTELPAERDFATDQEIRT